MRLLIVLIFLLQTTQVHSQKIAIDTTLLINQMCEMYNNDQSNYDNNTIRTAIFIENFNWLIKTTKEIGFPNYNLGRTSEERKCIGNFTSATLTHISQTNPHLLINIDIINLIKREINNGNINKQYFIDNLNYWYSGSVKLCSNDIKKYEYALKAWGMEMIPKTKFKKCN